MANVHIKGTVASIKNAFNYFYYIPTNLDNLFKVLSGGSFGSWWKNLFTKASDCISSIRSYPMIDFRYLYFTSSKHKIILGNKEFSDCEAYTCMNQHPVLVGSYVFPKPSSFIDLDPHTSIQLYLPYLEVIDLPVNEVVGGRLDVWYTLDLSTGMVTVVIEIDKNGNVYQIATKTAKLGIDVPWGVTNVVENIRSIMTTITTTAISIVALNVTAGASTSALAKLGAKVGTVTAVSKGAMSIANNLQIRYSRGGNASISTGTIMPSHPYLIIKKPKLVEVDELDYRATYGKPLYESRILAQLSGYTVVDEIHLTGLPDALDEEVTEIENLLKNGVHL